MKSTARRTAAVVGTVAALTSLTALSPAQSVTLAPSHVTVHTTDATPASGQTFRLYGAVFSGGERVAATVRVKTFHDGKRVPLKGAVMTTNRDNRYRIRIILHKKGKQQLRVVGHPKDAGIAKSHADIMETVH